MSVVFCGIISKPDKLQQSAEGNRTINHEYLIKSNSKNDGLLTIESAAQSASPAPLPALWSTYSHPITGESNSNLFLLQRDITRLSSKEGEWYFWKASCTWGPLPAGRSVNLPENPILWPVQYSLEWASHSRFVEYDLLGRPIANTAGDLFDPIEIDDARPVLVAVKNMASLPAIISLAIQFKNAINNAEFYGAPPFAAKVESIVSGTIQNTNGYSYYPMTIRIQFTNPNEFDLGWDFRLVNAGPHYKDGAGVKQRVRVLDGDNAGQLLQSANLDENGDQQADATPAILVPLDSDPDPYFRVYPPKNFALLGIGTSVT